MASAIVLEFHASHLAVVVLLGLGAILVLPLARMPLLKLYWQHGTSVLPSCVVIWPICTGMVPDLLFWAVLVLWPIWDHRSIQQRQLCKHQFFLASHQLAGSKMVLSRDHVVQKRWSCEVVGSHHCLFDISRPVVYLPSSMPANIPLLKVVLATGTSVFPSCACHLSRLGPHLYSKCGCTRLTTLAQLPGGCETLAFKQCHETLWSEKKIVFKWRSLIFGWHSGFACFTIQCPQRYRCSLLRSFADWTSGTRLPVCIQSAILCAKVQCVVPRWCFPCFPWRVQLGEVPWPHLTCPITTAIAWSPDGISIHWSGRIQKRRQRCRRRLLKSAPSQCEWVCAWACAFARLLLHSSPLLGWSLGVPLHQLLGEQFLVIVAQMMDHVLMWTRKFSSQKIVRFGFLLVCTSLVKCQHM